MSKTEPREDFLEEDAEVPGQKFCLLSFLSPEKVLNDKNQFMFNAFLKGYELSVRTKSLESYLMKTLRGINAQLDAEADSLDAKDLSGAATVCRSSKIRVDNTMNEFHEFVAANQKELTETKIKEAYEDFLYANKAKLEDAFYEKNEFRTTVRGLKVRGVYGSQTEAVARSKKLQRQDTLHNIFVGEVGKWLPWDPEPNDVADQEYAEDQLNTLMKKYKENEDSREVFQREQRERRSQKPALAAGSAPTMEIMPADASVAEAPNVETRFSDMFGSDGHADLAMARKMGKE